MKRYLLDTHVFLWWLSGDSSLGPRCREVISNGMNDVYVSAASTWEMSIKKALGKLKSPDDMDALVEEERFLKLPISLYHGQMAGTLPSYHRDPFDRMLIAQAQAEGLVLVTSDKMFTRYGVNVLDGSR